MCEIEHGLRALVPRQLEDNFEVAPNDVGLRGRLREPREAFQLALRFFTDLIREIRLVETLAKKLDFRARLVGLAELLLDSAHLLPQQHLSLLFRHLALHLARDVLPELEHAHFVLKIAVHQPKAFRELIDRKELLRFLMFEPHQRGQYVEPPQAVFFASGELRDVDLGLRPCERKNFRAQILHFSL